jgi:hypothetical protein
VQVADAYCNVVVDGMAFEELIRKFAEISNETAGEHFTPRGDPPDGQSDLH